MGVPVEPNVEILDFTDYVAKTKSPGYVELYDKRYEVQRSSLLIVGDSAERKAHLINCLLNRTVTDPLTERTVDEFICTFPKNSDKPWNFSESQTFEENISGSEGLLPDVPSSELKIRNVKGDYGPHSPCKVLLYPSSVGLLVLDIPNDLVSSQDLPSASGSVRNLSAPLDSLDLWLRTVDKCASHGNWKEFIECTIIVLIYGQQEKDNIIEEYKNKINSHLQTKRQCKYVFPEIFALKYKSELHKSIPSCEALKMAICQQSSRPDRIMHVTAPYKWYKLETYILKYCSDTNGRHVSLLELQKYAYKSLRMSYEDLKSFLECHRNCRNLIFSDKTLRSVENIYDNTTGPRCNPLVITHQSFLFDVFKTIIILWENISSMKSGYPSHQIRQEIKMDFEKMLISLKTLRHLWNEFDNDSIESLVDIFVQFDLLVPCATFWTTNSTTQRYIVPAIMAPHSSSQASCKGFQNFENLKPLIYWFHHSQDAVYMKISGFPTENLFLQLISALVQLIPERGAWNLHKLHSDLATFKAGPQRQIIVSITHHSCAVILRVSCLQKAITDRIRHVVMDIRLWLEQGIREIIRNVFTDLYCTVCVSPCLANNTAASVNECECLEALGNLGRIEQDLPYAHCEVNEKELSPEEFQSWFGIQQEKEVVKSLWEEQEREDTRKLNWYADKVSDESTLRTLAFELGVSSEQVDRRRTDCANDIKSAAFKILYEDWYRPKMGTLKDNWMRNQLIKALEVAKLPIYSEL